LQVGRGDSNEVRRDNSDTERSFDDDACRTLSRGKPPNAKVHRAGATALDEADDIECAGSGATASSAAVRPLDPSPLDAT
jgi:hypothetical protein